MRILFNDNNSETSIVPRFQAQRKTDKQFRASTDSHHWCHQTFKASTDSRHHWCMGPPTVQGKKVVCLQVAVVSDESDLEVITDF